MRPLRPAPGRVSLHARYDRRTDLGGARCLVAGAGALGRRILRRDHWSVSRRRLSGAHRQPGAMQHAVAHPGSIKRTYALDCATASDAMRAYGVGEWCRQTLGYWLDKARAGEDLWDWVVREMDRTQPDVAAAMHDCFEGVDTLPLLPRVGAPVLLLSGDKARSPRRNSRLSRTRCRTAGS